jgi:ABC-2 type transport system permease protein
MGVFFWVVLVQVPLVTMRSFSEEFKLGTIEMLMTAPVTEWQVVLAKYLAALTFFVVLWTPLYLDVQLLAWLTNGRVPVIWPLAGMTFLGLFLAGMFYVSVGVFTSILTRNQIVAAVLSFGILFFYFMFGFVSYVVTSETAKNFISYFMVFEHMRAWTIGLFDTRPVVLYVSGTLFFLLLTQRLLLARRLRG